MRIAICQMARLVREVVEHRLVERGHTITGRHANLTELAAEPAFCADALILGEPLDDAAAEALGRVRAREPGLHVCLLVNGFPDGVPHAELLDAVLPAESTFGQLEQALAGRIPTRWQQPVRRRAAWTPDSHLSPREREVVRLLVSGLTSVEMARRLRLSTSTIETHVQGVLRKLGARNRVEAVNRYLQATGPTDLASAG